MRPVKPLLREAELHILWEKKGEAEIVRDVITGYVNKRGVAHTSTWFLFKCSGMEGIFEFSDYDLVPRCGRRSLSCSDDKRDIILACVCDEGEACA